MVQGSRLTVDGFV